MSSSWMPDADGYGIREFLPSQGICATCRSLTNGEYISTFLLKRQQPELLLSQFW